MAGLYIHVPFCGQLCTYCDFHFSVSLSKMDDMVQAMIQEMRLRKTYLHEEHINTLYFGGGTPSLLSIEQLQLLIHTAQIEYGFNISQLAEFTIECNPEDLSVDYLRGLKEIGVTRLSIGIQSFNDNILALMNRRHNAARAVEAVESAQNAGFTNISVDLIFGVRGCDDNMLKSDLQRVVQLGTQHVSVYHLTIEDKTVLGWKKKNGKFMAVDETVSETQYKIVEQELLKAGFIHYEVSNYAQSGYPAKHNGSYWDGTEYIGVGPSAHSFNGVSRQWNVASNARYMEAISHNQQFYEYEELSDDERYNEYVMTSLRTARGILLCEVEKRWGRDRVGYILKEGEPFFRSGLLYKDGERVAIRSSNFLLSDAVITNLMI